MRTSLLAALALTACATDVAPNEVTGTIGGEHYTMVASASSLAVGGAAGFVVMANVDDLCSTPPVAHANEEMLSILLWTVDDAGVGHAPTAAGTFTVTADSNSKEPGQFASIDTEKLDAACANVNDLGHLATTGTVTLTTVDGAHFTGTFDATLDSGEHVTGRFAPDACASLLDDTIATCEP